MLSEIIIYGNPIVYNNVQNKILVNFVNQYKAIRRIKKKVIINKIEIILNFQIFVY